ncbi:hypothetical protein JCM19240_288 [Vibrio maritimus]|uniref:Uncharacterized protein n=1 Tax=Vibrio maritimus TaxID=990268 RepID=A0A090T676_9VIBR|nr:hypothetical protein JCM19240_288 [Vibrio maritimus]
MFLAVTFGCLIAITEVEKKHTIFVTELTIMDSNIEFSI